MAMAHCEATIASPASAEIFRSGSGFTLLL